MAIPIIQPQTPNYAQWDWNPGSTFLAAAKTTASMLDNIKQAEQMDRKLALDEKIKETMLPYELLDAQAKIDFTKAQTALAASRSRALADNSQTAAMLNGMGDLTTEQLYDIAGLSAPSETPPARVKADQPNSAPTTPSPTGGGDFKSINLPAGPLQSFYEQDDDALTSIAGRLPDGSTMDELTNPKFSMASSSKEGVSTDVAPRAAEMSVLKARSFEPKVTNPLDWDADPAVTQTTAPQKATWSSEAEQELKGIRSKLESNPLESLPDVQPPRPEGSSIGAYISKRYNDLQTVSQKARNSKGQDRKTLSAVAMALEGRIYQDVASKYGIDDPAVVQNLIKGPGGLRRTADEIESIYGIMKDRSVEVLDDNGNPRQLPVTDWSQAFQAAEIKRNSLKSALKSKEDSLKSATEIQNLLSKFTDESGNPLSGKEAIVDGLNSQLDTAIGAPTGVAAYSYRYGRISDRVDKLQRAMDAGVTLGDITKDQLPQEIARLNQEQVALSVEKAPYFKDRESLAKWLSDSNTRNLPYFTDVGNTRALVKATTDPNVMEIWSPTESTWGRMDVNKPASPPEKQEDSVSKDEPEKTPNKLGKSIYDSARNTLAPVFNEPPSKLAGRVVDRGADAVLKAGDYAATAVKNRVVAPAAEFLAGTVGEDLTLDRTPNPKPQNRPELTPEERLEMIERLIGGPLQGVGKEIIRKKLSK